MIPRLRGGLGTNRAVLLMVLIIMPLVLPACASQGARGQNLAYREPADPRQPEIKRIFRLQPGDVIDVKFYYEPRLNERVAVRLDGNISLQLVGEVFAEGMTPDELRTHLVESYSRFIQEPTIAVIVREFEGQKAYIGGEVTSPSVIDLTRKTTPLQAIFRVGGFKESAHPGSVIVISEAPDGTPFVRSIDLKPVLAGKVPDQNLYLKANDVVYVPKSFIADANKFVREYITNMIPGNLGANFTYTIFEGKQTGILTTP